jgi:hypothetical protein
MTRLYVQSVWVLVAVFALPLTTGCQNKIHVRVEKVRNVWSMNRESRIGRALEDAIESLSHIVNQCTQAEIALDRHIESLEPEVQEGERSFTSGYRAVLRGTADDARELIRKCEAIFFPPSPASTDAPLVVPRQTLAEVREFLDLTSRNRQTWKEALAGFPELETLLEKVRLGQNKNATAKEKEDAAEAEGQAELLEVIHRGRDSVVVAAAAEAAKTTKIGFGGFMSTDVFVINPSDPKYAEILKSPSPVGSFFVAPWYRNTSVETLTEAVVAVTGDSAVMLVMESPGQVRVYQVRMDPTQITRNIGLLVSKATGAAAKYAAGGG